MNILESVFSAVLGSDDKKQMLAGLAAQLLTGQSSAPGAPNGLGGLIQQFQNAGLGNLVNSWISTGENQPATSEHIQQALGNETIQHFAQQTGLHGSEVATLLAQLLPEMVNKVTPIGTVPQTNDLQGMLSGLLGSLAK